MINRLKKSLRLNAVVTKYYSVWFEFQSGSFYASSTNACYNVSFVCIDNVVPTAFVTMFVCGRDLLTYLLTFCADELHACAVVDWTTWYCRIRQRRRFFRILTTIIVKFYWLVVVACCSYLFRRFELVNGGRLEFPIVIVVLFEQLSACRHSIFRQCDNICYLWKHMDHREIKPDDSIWLNRVPMSLMQWYNSFKISVVSDEVRTWAQPREARISSLLAPPQKKNVNTILSFCCRFQNLFSPSPLKMVVLRPCRFKTYFARSIVFLDAMRESPIFCRGLNLTPQYECSSVRKERV